MNHGHPDDADRVPQPEDLGVVLLVKVLHSEVFEEQEGQDEGQAGRPDPDPEVSGVDLEEGVEVPARAGLSLPQ